MKKKEAPPTKNILLAKKVKEYQGSYIAVAKNKIIASARSAIETFELAKKILGHKKIEGIYYIPSQKDLLIAL